MVQRITLLVFVVVCGLSACSSGADRPIAEIAGNPVYQISLDRYLSKNLVGEPDPDVSKAERSQMMSRLFDQFIEHQVLLYQAEQQKIQVDEREIEFYLTEFFTIEGETSEDSATPIMDDPDFEAQRESIIQDLKVQKLRDQLYRQPIPENAQAIRAYAMENAANLKPKLRWVVRSMAFDDQIRAQNVYDQIQTGQMTFDEAEVFYGENETESQATRLDPASLSPGLREIMEELREGETAPPREIASRWRLFHLVRRDTPDSNEAELFERAKEAWMREQRQVALIEKIEEYKTQADVKIFRKRLPFRYVPDES